MDFLEWLSNSFNSIVNAIFDILPTSPIVYLSKDKIIGTYLSYVNYFIPIYLWLSILEAWGIAVAIYYCYKIVLRWIKLE